MLGAIKNFFGFGDKEEETPKSAKEVMDKARRAAEKDVGRTLPHDVVFKTRQSIGNALGRCHHRGSRSLVELAEHLKKDPVELFVTYYHELLHAAGIMKEGAVEWLAQKAAKLNGFTPKDVVYARETKAFDQVAKWVSPNVSDTRTHFSTMLKAALGSHSHLVSRATQGLKKLSKKQHHHAQKEVEELLKKAA